jgi:hypothetical protein
MADDAERFIEIDDPGDPEQVMEDKISRLEHELANIQPGVQVIIERLQPSWCRGQLEKLTIGDEGLTVDYLIQKWGGHLLSIKIIGKKGRLRGQHTVELYTFDPRKYGKQLKAPFSDDSSEPSVQSPAPVIVQNNQANEIMLKCMEMMAMQQKSQIDTLTAILQSKIQADAVASAAVPTTSGNQTWKSMLDMVTGFQKLKSVFAEMSPAPTGDLEEAFPSQIMDMLKMAMGQGNQRANITQPKPPPNLPPSRQPIQVNNNPTAAPAPAPLNDKKNLAVEISNLSSDKAAETILDAIALMPKGKQERAMQAFWTAFQDTMSDAADDEYEDEQGEETSST